MNRCHRAGLRLGAGILVAGLVLLTSGCTGEGGRPAHVESTVDSVTVNIGPTNSYQSISVGRTTGLLEEALARHGAELAWKGPFPAFPPILEAANAGEIEVGSGGLTNYVTAVANGSPIVAIGIEDISASVGIVATGRSRIATLQELRGKRVAVNKGGTGEYLLLRALDREGIDPSEVERVYLVPEDAAAAFNSDNVDAWATWDQYFAGAQLVPGSTVLVTGTDIDNLNWTFQWVTRDFADAHPELVRTIVGTLQEANRRAAQDPGIVAELYRGNGATEEVIDLILSWPAYTFHPLGEEEIALLHRHADDLAAYGLIDEVPDLGGTFFEFQG